MSKYRWYVGMTRVYLKREAFKAERTPTSVSFPQYYAVIGPFRTKRAALWSAANPASGATVSEAEKLAKMEARNV